VVVAHVLDEIARSARASASMFWETLWPLVLGFGMSGAVQASVSRRSVERTLGTHRPSAVLRAAVYGTASSSCSYAASAMSRSLFKRGADFVASLVFLIASTNLVVELGFVLVVLLGWQFAAAEYLGGVVMIILVAALGGFWFQQDRVAALRQRLREDDPSEQTGHEEEPRTGSGGARVQGRWISAATYAVADLKMLRRELFIGYAVAGVLTVMVPVHVWSAVLLRGHGPWTLLENVTVAPLIAVVSFVCSIGNVPIAAALWHGGIAFAGVIAFLFADLITIPLLLIYRRFYGTRTMIRMLVLFWAAIAVASLVTQGLCSIAGIEPTRRATIVAPLSFSWNFTTYLDAASLVLLVLLYLPYRSSRRRGSAQRASLDPVCGMFVETATAPASMQSAGRTYSFCSQRCHLRFEQSLSIRELGPLGIGPRVRSPFRRRPHAPRLEEPSALH
jgi:uncharacterized protein